MSMLFPAAFLEMAIVSCCIIQLDAAPPPARGSIRET